MKSNENDRNFKKRFEKGFRILTASRSPYEVWSDLMAMYSAAISNTCTLNNEFLKLAWEEREKEYLRIIKKYTKKEQNIISQMFALLVLEFERNSDQDLLGSIYMELEIGNKNAGQFFTPYNLCDLMSNLVINKPLLRKQVKEKGYASVYDAACGAGATLISAVNQCRRLFNRLNFQNHVYFVGQDIDVTVARMCYIQLSLLGVAGIIKIGNTLTDPDLVVTKDNCNQYYFTPIYFSEVWTLRRLFHNLDMCMNRRIEKDGKNK